MRSPLLPIVRGTPKWRAFIDGHLREGYGAEDIALRLRCEPGFVRAHIMRLRKKGLLKSWWKPTP